MTIDIKDIKEIKIEGDSNSVGCFSFILQNGTEIFIKTREIRVLTNNQKTYKENWNPDWKGDPDDENRWKGW